jgi:hypothetical protein
LKRPLQALGRLAFGVTVFVSGVIAGLVAGLLLGHTVDAGWLGAAGAWFGGLATVFTVVVAVLVFRAERREREREAQKRLEQIELAALTEARLFVVKATAGGWSEGNAQGLGTVNPVRLTVFNGSPTTTATEVRVGIVDLEFADLNAGPGRRAPELIMPPTSSNDWYLQPKSPLMVPMDGGRQPQLHLAVWARYRMGDRLWLRFGAGEPSSITRESVLPS